MTTLDTVLETLSEKIQRQGRFIAELQAELQQARQASVAALLGPLRLREAVLLYVGQDVEDFNQEITKTFGSDIACTVSTSLFVLDRAPVSNEVRGAIRNAIDHGMCRW